MNASEPKAAVNRIYKAVLKPGSEPLGPAVLATGQSSQQFTEPDVFRPGLRQ